jgi:putative ABC transport system substrate-binding protein
MRRRDFITLRGGVAAHGARTKSGDASNWLPPRWVRQTISRVSGSASPSLKETGYTERENVAIEFRWADGDYSRLPALAAELVRLQVAVIVAGGGESTVFAAKAATSTIPIVFNVGRDPVELGLVANLSRPGGNITGVNILATEIVTKRIGLSLGLTVPFGLLNAADEVIE